MEMPQLHFENDLPQSQELEISNADFQKLYLDVISANSNKDSSTENDEDKMYAPYSDQDIQHLLAYIP